MTTIKPNTFAEACYDQNSIAELEEALAGQPDVIDMETWRLTAPEWYEQIEIALEEKLKDLDNIDEELAKDVVANMSEYGDWPADWNDAYLRGYLDSAWADNAPYSELDEAQRTKIVPMVARKVRELLAS